MRGSIFLSSATLACSFALALVFPMLFLRLNGLRAGGFQCHAKHMCNPFRRWDTPHFPDLSVGGTDGGGFLDRESLCRRTAYC